jgi:hypothetical protein
MRWKRNRMALKKGTRMASQKEGKKDLEGTL